MVKIIEKATGQEVKQGDELTDFRGDKAKLIQVTGHKLYVEWVESPVGVSRGEYFVSVFGCELVEES